MKDQKEKKMLEWFLREVVGKKYTHMKNETEWREGVVDGRNQIINEMRQLINQKIKSLKEEK